MRDLILAFAVHVCNKKPICMTRRYYNCNYYRMYIVKSNDSHSSASESRCGKIDISITKTCLYNFDPLKPHFYIVKLGFTGVYNIFLISAQKHRLWVLVGTRRGGSNEYPQSMFLSRNMKNVRIFYLEIFRFLVVKFSIYLNGRVFVMGRTIRKYIFGHMR